MGSKKEIIKLPKLNNENYFNSVMYADKIIENDTFKNYNQNMVKVVDNLVIFDNN